MTSPAKITIPCHKEARFFGKAPFLMYRTGASVRHRERHLKWNNLILPKDDPLWNSIFPPNGYGCKCHTVAVTESRKRRYEQDGVPAYNPDTRKTVRIPAQAAAPKPNYRNYFNERKGTLERIPQGITPGFNWNQGQTGRTVPVLQECLKKAQKEMPQAVDSVIRALQNSTIYRDRLSDFVDQAYANKAERRVNNKNTAPVGFLDRKLNFLPEVVDFGVGVVDERGVGFLAPKQGVGVHVQDEHPVRLVARRSRRLE
ncbi:MAG: hypothetical protein K2N31_05785, partial [Treponemataceae bacterium]|nr:hypothetical protein [Treponemataceae bacterium]